MEVSHSTVRTHSTFQCPSHSDCEVFSYQNLLVNNFPHTKFPHTKTSSYIIPPTIMQVSHSGLTPLFSVTLIQIMRFWYEENQVLGGFVVRRFGTRDFGKMQILYEKVSRSRLTPLFSVTLTQIVRFSSKLCSKVIKTSSYQNLLLQNVPHTKIPCTKTSSQQNLFISNFSHSKISLYQNLLIPKSPYTKTSSHEI